MAGRTRRRVLALLCALLWLLAVVPTALAAARRVPYSRFLDQVRRGQVSVATITGQYLRALYADGSEGWVYVPEAAAGLPGMLIQYGVAVEFAPEPGPSLGSFLIRLLPPLIVIAAIFYMTRRGLERGTRGLLSVEQGPARLHRPGDSPITMQDVAGLDEAKAELQEIVDFLRDPGRFRALGARIPRGVLLSGPPGTGKTLLARAVAGEAGVDFLSMAGSQFVELYAGLGAARVRALFAEARRHAPCIVFIDEIDAVARQRGGGAGGGAEERDQTINQLLVEMDGFTPAEGIIVMAATNRIDVLDAAILRPGRFDRQIQVHPPDRRGREQILAVHGRGKPLGPDVSLEQVAAMTAGFTGADLENLLNEAALLAARRRNRSISMAEIAEAYERTVAGGPVRRRSISQAERLRIAYHEAGHALVGRRLNRAEHLVKLSILPRGTALGYAIYQPAEDRYLLGREEGLNRLATLLAGRAAEELVLGEGSTGAADDLEQATRLARSMVEAWGMHPGIGPVSAAGAEPYSSSDQALRSLDEAVRHLIAEGYRRAKVLLLANRTLLDRVAAALVERETLEGPELERLLPGEGPEPERLVPAEGPASDGPGADSRAGATGD